MDTATFTRRITAFPAALQTSTRQRLARSLEQLRIALDLPSRKELAELTARLEALDARIAALAAERVAGLGRSMPTLPEAPAESAPAPTDEASDAAADHDAAADPAPAEASDAAPAEANESASSAQSGGKKKPLKNRR